ncbi:MAG: serine hydrolase [Patescibacteria group bacterium]
MRYYLYSASLILLAILVITFIPFLTERTEEYFIAFQIPQNNSKTLGIQKYNIPPISKNLPPPYFSARAVFIKDLSTDTILFQKDANLPLPTASTTKIMTAIVGAEYFKQNSILTVKDGAKIPGASVGLFSGEDLSFRSLLYGMLLSSGNDAAYTIAENFPGGIPGFVSQMNRKASLINLENTHFDNPAGFDSPKHFSTARDLSKITEEALKDSILSRIFQTKETDIVSLDKKFKHKLYNLNKLLTQVTGVLGVKTGTTPQAKENLITLVERNGKRVLIVLFGSDDRFLETKKLIEWTYSNFEWFN